MANRRHVTPLRVVETGYVPDDDEGRAYHAKLKPGQLVGAEIARSRSLPQHKRYWSILTKVVEHCPGEWRTPEALHEVLKVATGHVEIVKLIDGRLVKIPQSTAFDAMNQTEFEAYHTAAIKVIEDEILGGMSCDELLAHADTPATNAAARIMRNGDWGGN